MAATDDSSSYLFQLEQRVQQLIKQVDKLELVASHKIGYNCSSSLGDYQNQLIAKEDKAKDEQDYINTINELREENNRLRSEIERLCYQRKHLIRALDERKMTAKQVQ